MASYSLRVNLNDKWRKQWSSVPDAKLCFAMSYFDTLTFILSGFDSHHQPNKDQANTISTGFSSDAPSDGFLFTNEVECSVLLLCEIDGKFVPVYTSHAGNLSPGSSEVIIPKNKVYVWFSDDAKSSTMTETLGSAREIEINGPGYKTATFDEAGNWTVV
ncbi:hypothetical protein NW752_005931 [Fusarium irregulare]|uniref:Uncharacterized protein n=1 Tax=Fusarium irregulare TaxID=2494466 RepID=A0A9W8U934_9HYPO|nr:hypothetical protein NW766_006468 [Fusarium irregulare]KAJ4018803.1 hypothetical protein NW752_005931 [Fusarium irregulare]